VLQNVKMVVFTSHRDKLKNILKQKKIMREKGGVVDEPEHGDMGQERGERTIDFRKQGEYGAKKNIKP
jgi:hypothetical protein